MSALPSKADIAGPCSAPAKRVQAAMPKIQVGDLRISLDDVGAGEQVVLIHGLACGKRMWFHQIRALRKRFRVIAYVSVIEYR